MKKEEFKFDLKAIEAAEEEYHSVQPEPLQKKIIKELSEIVSKYILISKFAIRGFIILSIRKWQMEEKKLVADIMSIDPEERIIEVVKIINNCRGFLLKAMIKREQQTELDESINQVIAFYKEKYAFR